MAMTNHERVGKAMELLKAGLGPFVAREIKAHRVDSATLRRLDDNSRIGDRQVTDRDVAALLKLMRGMWNDVFRAILGRAAIGFVHELLDHRNRWAHQEPFSVDDAYRALDTAGRLLAAVSAPQAPEVDRLKMELLRVRFDEQARGEQRGHADRAAGGTATPRNTSSPSGGTEYRCPIPGCSKVFHGSRGGWDAHVASIRLHPAWYPDVSNPEERKRIFKHEYADWFRTRHASSAAIGSRVGHRPDGVLTRRPETDMSLRYDMGNAGDLLKHGVLAEFIRWRCESNGAFRFIDPFGGEPWSEPVPEVVRRIRALPEGCALRLAQPDLGESRYYCSGLVACRTADACGRTGVRVLASDQNPARRERLRARGLSPLSDDFPGCGDDENEFDGYAALDQIVPGAGDGDLLLLDPFHEFLLRKAPRVVPRLAEMAGRSAVLLFALNLDPNNWVGRRFDDLLAKHLPGAWRMTCPPLRRNTGVKGESTFHADVVLAARAFGDVARGSAVAKLWTRLAEYSRHLADALDLPDGTLAPRKVPGNEATP